MAQKHRTTPTQTQLRIWRDYIETTQTLSTLLTRRLQSESSLSPGDYQVLLALTEAPQHMLRSAGLATVIGWERSRLSHHLGRMEKRDLIGRTRCADDAHGVDVTATAAGHAVFRAASVPHLRAVRELFVDALTPEQLAQLDSITSTLRQHLGVDGSASSAS